MEKTTFKVEYDNSSKKESEVFYINGSRTVIKRGEKVKVNPIIEEIYEESQRLRREANNGFEMADGKIINH